MTTVIRMPAFTATMETGKLISWLVEEGARVAKGQVIAEVETDKAIAEVESPVDGVVLKILMAAGDEDIDVETPLLELGTDEDADEPKTAAASPEPAQDEMPSKSASPKRAQEAPRREDERIPASPSARRAARDAGVDLREIEGSGPRGRITKEDVVAHLNKAQSEAGSGTNENSSMRRAIARAMVQSKSTVPHFYTQTDLVIDDLLKMRDQVGRDNPETRVTLTTLLVAAVSRALTEVKEARYYWENDEVVFKNECDIGVAVALDGGVVVPVIRKADSLGIIEIATRLDSLITDARAGALKQSSLGRASLTISNLGMFSVDAFYPIVNMPEPMIVGVGRSRRIPHVIDEKIEIRSAVTVTLAIDHRVIDGAIAGRFLDALRGYVEAPESSGLGDNPG